MSSVKSFWKTIPRKSLIIFMVGVFFIFTIPGFANDIRGMGREPVVRLALYVLLFGLFSVSFALTGLILRGQFWKAFVPLFVLMQVLANLVNRWLPSLRPSGPMSAADLVQLHDRLTFDAVAIVFAVGVGYTCFLYVSITEGRRYFRVYGEMELASEIHRVLVPTVDSRIGDFECYGLSVPSGEVGGDLIDVARSKDGWVAYVADVSGHGVAPGVVMGMVKSASRMLLSSGDDAGRLLPQLNEVLYPLKNPEMFVTFCFVAKNANGLRIGLAGHPAILHFSSATNAVTPLEGANMPLGIIPSGEFLTSQITTDAGDVLVLYTDGLLEVANPAGEEFGLQRLQEEVRKHGKKPLNVACRSLLESVAQHGVQFDDQSILLIRQL